MLFRSAAQFTDEVVQRTAHCLGELDVATRIHHHVRHSAHQVFAEADLRVHQAGRSRDLAGREIGEVRGDLRAHDAGAQHAALPEALQLAALTLTGMIGSTLLTVVVVPSLFVVLQKLETRLRGEPLVPPVAVAGSAGHGHG